MSESEKHNEAVLKHNEAVLKRMNDPGLKSAFPFQGDGWNPQQCGLTKREWFAGMALQGLCANGGMFDNKLMAIEAVERADALIGRLNSP